MAWVRIPPLPHLQGSHFSILQLPYPLPITLHFFCLLTFFFFSPTVENPQRDPSFHSLSPYTGISTCKSYFFQFSLFFFFNGMGKGREKKETAGQSTSLPSLLHKPTNPATLKNGNKNVSLFPWESILRYLEKLSTVCLRL